MTPKEATYLPLPGYPSSSPQVLLLRAALLPGEEALAAWRHWRSQVKIEIEHVDAGSFRLLPLVYRNLRKQGMADPLLKRLKGVYRLTWYQNQLHLRAAAEVIQLLQSAGIETLCLKGVPLLLRYYQDYGLRPMGDFDVLVPTVQRDAAIECLIQAGWQAHWRPATKLTKDYLKIKHSWNFTHANGGEFDLHWHVMIECLDAQADNDFWARAEPLEFHDISTLALCPTDQLMHVCVHGMAINKMSPVRWVADAMVILQTHNPLIDWSRLVDQAQQRRVSLFLGGALGYLRDTLAAPIPEETLKRLSAIPVTRLERLEYQARVNPSASYLGALPLTWAYYLRYQQQLIPNQSRLKLLVGFPRYVQLFLGFDDLKQTFAWAIKRGLAQLHK
ncbi:MAG TPA: nucleotidyltransferase family protein [Anaerolineae bacterium]|nr:nucleotidyltransferase family protein [Anaerolineae bacterium]